MLFKICFTTSCLGSIKPAKAAFMNVDVVFVNSKITFETSILTKLAYWPTQPSKPVYKGASAFVSLNMNLLYNNSKPERPPVPKVSLTDLDTFKLQNPWTKVFLCFIMFPIARATSFKKKVKLWAVKEKTGNK